MKRATVDAATGDVVCPSCGARNQFAERRTGRAKIVGTAAVGVGALAAPKRLRCLVCGGYLKRVARAGSYAQVKRDHKLSARGWAIMAAVVLFLWVVGQFIH